VESASTARWGGQPGRSGAAARAGRGRRPTRRAGLATFARGKPYLVCDLDGQPITPSQAKHLIAEHFTVPTEVRRRRSSTKAGKAPQMALKAQVKSQREAGHEATFPTPA